MNIMIKVQATAITIFICLSSAASAADRPVIGPRVIYATPPVVRPYVVAPTVYVQPYFIVNQGPELSGPDISISKLSYVNTDLHRSYPFIGTYDPGAATTVLSARAEATGPIRHKRKRTH
jgi:hypothetical protein